MLLQGALQLSRVIHQIRQVARLFSSSSLLASPELSDITVYAPEIRSRLGTAAHFCEKVVPFSFVELVNNCSVQYKDELITDFYLV